MKFILASQSPRRRELLGYLLNDFDVASANIDESVLDQESPKEYVERLAQHKAQVIAERQDNSSPYLVIGSDTSVIFKQHILGKPEDLADCQRMLSMLSGQTHQVLTAFSVVGPHRTVTKTVSTDVRFVELTEQDIEAYWATGEPQDKAGAYAIQGIGGKFVAAINGSVSSVVGLPLAELQQVLKEMQNL